MLVRCLTALLHILHYRSCRHQRRPSFVHRLCLPCWRQDQPQIRRSLRRLLMANGPLIARFLSPQNLLRPVHIPVLQYIIWHAN